MTRALLMRIVPKFSLLLTLFFFATGCGKRPVEMHPTVDTTLTVTKPVLQLIDESPQLRRFHQALDLTGYRELLERTGPFTVFAPVDEGFLRTMSIDSAFAESLRDSLTGIVGLHLVRGELKELWSDSIEVSTLAMHPITLRNTEQGLLVEGRSVLNRYVGRNGMLYVISSHLEPPPPDTTRGLLERRRAERT